MSIDLKNLKFSDKQYVCVAKQHYDYKTQTTHKPKWDKQNPQLGFAIPYILDKTGKQVTKACKSRMETVDNWGTVNSRAVGDTQGIVKILDNKFQSGFRILDYVSRCSTSNKVFNIFDPRGFILQLYCEATMYLIENCTIINGTIQDKLIWSNTGQLITESDYNEVCSQMIDKRAQKTVRCNTVPLGAKVELDTGEIVTWYGKYHTLISEYLGSYSERAYVWSKTKRGYIKGVNTIPYYNTGDEQIIMGKNKIRIIRIIDTTSSITETEALATINKCYNDGKCCADFTAHLVSSKPFDIKLEVVTGKSSILDDINPCGLFKYDDSVNMKYSSNWQKDNINYKKLDIDKDSYKFHFAQTDMPKDTKVISCYLCINNIKVK